MKNILFIYNVIFLLFGNVLFSSIHNAHEHHGHYHEYEQHECSDCISFENSHGYVIISHDINFSDKNYLLIFTNLNAFSFKIYSQNLSRAPPITL